MYKSCIIVTKVPRAGGILEGHIFLGGQLLPWSGLSHLKIVDVERNSNGVGYTVTAEQHERKSKYLVIVNAG